ncbi:MAG: hypothetical protein JO210_14105 [Acidobacteriaceae bacterium]|nr:hypothetical protein [Acidobacteriaceae bacterium]
MNKYEQQAARQRGTSLRNSMTLWSAGAALVMVVLLILGLSSSVPSEFYKRAAVVAAILLLLLRQTMRRLRGRPSRAAEPDPQSTLKLD